MNARSVLITVIAAALVGACAATPVQEEQQEPQPSLGARIFVGIAEIMVNAVFDAAFSPHEKQKHASNSWAHSPTPAAKRLGACGQRRFQVRQTVHGNPGRRRGSVARPNGS